MGFIEWLRRKAPKKSVLGKIRDRQDYIGNIYDKFLSEELKKKDGGKPVNMGQRKQRRR